MQLIDRDVINWCDILPDNPRQVDLLAISKSKHFIETQPVIDAEPVVRCKDCKYYWENWKDGEPDDKVAVCLTSPKDDAFCSEGERREDEQVH